MELLEGVRVLDISRFAAGPYSTSSDAAVLDFMGE